MKRSVLLIFIVLTAATCASAQVAPAARGRRAALYAGAEGSFFQPDYAGTGAAQASPYHLYGIGAFVDADFSRWVQIEAEGRWLRWNEYNDVDENTYLIGPRVPIVDDYHGLTPYGKFLVGWGSGAFLDGRATAWVYGGGVDYRIRHSRFSVRCFDFEYQNWRVEPTLHPYGYSAGISYKVF